MKSIVNEIFRENTNYLTAQQAVNQARSLKSLSNDLYTDPLRFVYELVQNCDDSCHSKSILRISIVEHRYLIVCHNGKPFDENDVKGLCDIGCSTKRDDQQKTGYKGLGFKAVFGKSDCVWILSKGEYFRFESKSKAFQWNSNWGTKDQKTWEENNQRSFEFPWQICPIWTERKDVPQSIQQWFVGQLDAVATIVQLKNSEETKSAIEQLIQQPHVFMFLRNLRTIRFSINSPQETLLNIHILHDQSIKIICDSKPISHWLLFSSQIEVPSLARQDLRLPEKLQTAAQTEMILAACIDRNDNIESVQGKQSALFTYLPTKITTYNLPILVNAQFLVNASREYIQLDSPWNRFLFEQIPRQMINWIGFLKRQEKWSEKALDLLPKRLNVKDELAECFNKNCDRAIHDVPFLVNYENRLLKIDEAVIDLTGFSKPNCIGYRLIREYFCRNCSTKSNLAENPFVPNNKRVRQFQIELFTWEHCFQMLNSNEFLTNFSIEQNIQFIQYLFNEYQKQPQIHDRLRQLPFLMDHTNVLRSVQSIYLPSQFNSADWAANHDTDPYLHPTIIVWMQKYREILEWLRSFGLTEKTDELFIHRKILPDIRHYINPSNFLQTIRKLFDSYRHGYVRMELIQKLNKLKLMSCQGNFVCADELYFSDEYFPKVSLGDFRLDPSNFLSTIYLQQIEGTPEQKKIFFQLLGVQEDIKLIQFNENTHNEIIAAYRFKQTENLLRYTSLQFHRRLTISFLEFTQNNYNFAVFFWQTVFHSINIKQLIESEILLRDDQQIPIDNLPYWFVRTRNCIPTITGELRRSLEVYSNDLKPFAGDFLPVFACQSPNHHLSYEWQRFFQFKTSLSIDDHLKLLKSIYNRSKIDDEIEASIQRIYTKFMDFLSTLDQRQYDQYRPKELFYLLSTTNNQFLPTNQLVLSLNKEFTLPNEVDQIKLSSGNLTHRNLGHFLDFFRIRLIQIEDLTVPNILNPQLSFSLRSRLRDLQSYLFELVDRENIQTHRIDLDFEVFEVDQLELFYNQTIPVVKRSIHSIDNRIYVTRPWNSNEIISKLSQILCSKFQLNDRFQSEIREFLMDDEITSSMSSFSLDSSKDFLDLKSNRTQFEANIQRDNQQLFTHPGLNDETTTPGELLLQGLRAQNSPHSGYIYHYTHVENVSSILRGRSIKSRNQLNSTDDEIKNYVRFYFRPLTPSQYCNEFLGRSNQPMCPVPIFIQIDLQGILENPNIKWKVSLGNLANRQTEFGNTIDIIKRFDFQYIYSDIRSQRGKYSSQQEFLIKSHLDLSQIDDQYIKLIFPDENALDCLLSLTDDVPYSQIINSDFYFRRNSRVHLDFDDDNRTLVVSIENIDSSKDYGQIMIQISGNDTNRIIEGNLTKTIQHGNLSTIYAENRFELTGDLDSIQYAIYYEFDNDKWLIHTNSLRQNFIC